MLKDLRGMKGAKQVQGEPLSSGEDPGLAIGREVRDKELSPQNEWDCGWGRLDIQAFPAGAALTPGS